MIRLLGVALSVLAAGAILAACGDDTEERNTYFEQVNRAQQSFVQSSSRVTTELEDSSTIASYRKGIEELVAALEKTTGRLRGIDPPEEVGAQHEQLVEALSSYGSQLDEVAEALDEDAESSELLKARRDLLELSGEVEADVNRIIGEINGRLGD